MSIINQSTSLTDFTSLPALRRADLAPQSSAATQLNNASSGAAPEEVRDTFAQFVGQSFFGQMIKAMRQTQGKPAYFHGGRAEEVFQSQLDQQLAEQMTKVTADQLADPMFRRQFPAEAAALAQSSPAVEGLAQLDMLRPR